MLKRSKKMTSKWRVISMAICIQNKSSRKTKTKTQLRRKKLMKKWVKSKTNSVNRIWKTIRVGLRVKNRQMLKLMAKSRALKNLSIINNKKNKGGKEKTDNKQMNKKKNKKAIGMTTTNRAKRLISKKLLRWMKNRKIKVKILVNNYRAWKMKEMRSWVEIKTKVKIPRVQIKMNKMKWKIKIKMTKRGQSQETSKEVACQKK